MDNILIIIMAILSTHEFTFKQKRKKLTNLSFRIRPMQSFWMRQMMLKFDVGYQQARHMSKSTHAVGGDTDSAAQ
jgi:hypothetical protein